jgi:hypothetical protein
MIPKIQTTLSLCQINRQWTALSLIGRQATCYQNLNCEAKLMDHFLSYSNPKLTMQYIYNILAHTSMTCIYSGTEHDGKNSAYRISIPNTNSEITHFQSLKLFLKSTLLIIMPLNHSSDYKCAQTYIQILCAYNHTLSDVSTNHSLHDSLAPTIVQLYNHNLCLNLLFAVVVRRQSCFASLVTKYLWVWDRSLVTLVAVINGGGYEDCRLSGCDAI